MERSLTGTKDVDLYILSRLEDQDLFSFCLVNKDANQLCHNQDFWRNRFMSKFGQHAMKYNSSQNDERIPSFEGIYKPAKRNWRNHYLKVVVDLNEYSIDPFVFFDEISWIINNDPNDPKNIRFNLVTLKDAPEKLKNQYWMLNLGNSLMIYYPVDRHEDFSSLRQEYNLPQGEYFTPAKVLNLIYNFYQEPLTKRELEGFQNGGALLADDYTLEEAEQGKVKRIDMLGYMIFFEGLKRLARNTLNKYILEFGS